MSLVEVDAVHDALDGLINGSVVEDDVGCLATKLEGQLLLGASDRPLNGFPNLGRAGEGNLVHVRVFNQHAPCLAGTGDDVDDARRESGLLTDVGERESGEWRRFRGLEHHRIAAGQGGGDLPGKHQQWEVPRNHLRGDAERLRVGPVAGELEFVGPTGVVEEVRGHER